MEYDPSIPAWLILKHLHLGTQAIGLGVLHDRGQRTDAQYQADQAESERTGYGFDYYHGRPLKCRISDGSISRPDLYDRDAGHGACARAIAAAHAAASGVAVRPVGQGAPVSVGSMSPSRELKRLHRALRDACAAAQQPCPSLKVYARQLLNSPDGARIRVARAWLS